MWFFIFSQPRVLLRSICIYTLGSAMYICLKTVPPPPPPSKNKLFSPPAIRLLLVHLFAFIFSLFVYMALIYHLTSVSLCITSFFLCRSHFLNIFFNPLLSVPWIILAESNPPRPSGGGVVANLSNFQYIHPCTAKWGQRGGKELEQGRLLEQNGAWDHPHMQIEEETTGEGLTGSYWMTSAYRSKRQDDVARWPFYQLLDKYLPGYFF